MMDCSTTYGILTIITHSIAQPPSIASEYFTRLKRGSDDETTAAVDRFPQIEFLVSNFLGHGMVIEFRAESRELVNLKNSIIVYGVLYHWHTTVNVTLTTPYLGIF